MEITGLDWGEIQKGLMPKNADQKSNFTLYLDNKTLESLKKDADENFRSTNQHVLWIINEYLKQVKK